MSSDRTGRAALIAAIFCSLPLSAQAQAQAQAPAPGQPRSPASQAALREIVPPTGVGGCIFRALGPDVRQAALADVIQTGNPVSAGLRDATAQVAARCTGRPYSASDLALVAAVTSTFIRAGAAVYFIQEPAVGQSHFDAAWRDAAAADRGPFIASARSFLSDGPPTPPPADPAVLAPFEQKLGLDPGAVNPRIAGMMLRYYAATALGEQAELKLAAERPKSAR